MVESTAEPEPGGATQQPAQRPGLHRRGVVRILSCGAGGVEREVCLLACAVWPCVL